MGEDPDGEGGQRIIPRHGNWHSQLYHRVYGVTINAPQLLIGGSSSPSSRSAFLTWMLVVMQRWQ